LYAHKDIRGSWKMKTKYEKKYSIPGDEDSYSTLRPSDPGVHSGALMRAPAAVGDARITLGDYH